MKRQHVVIISIDALLKEDLNDLSNLPNLQRIKAHGSMVEAVRSIYPSLTHPAHAVSLGPSRLLRKPWQPNWKKRESGSLFWQAL